MRQVYDHTLPRQPVNLSLNSDLVAKARSENLNLSAIAESALPPSAVCIGSATSSEPRFPSRSAISALTCDLADEHGETSYRA